MYKLILVSAFVLSGCTHFTINTTMCDEIALQPGQVIPKECRNYNEKEADKAFNKVVDDKKVSDKDIEFSQEED